MCELICHVCLYGENPALQVSYEHMGDDDLFIVLCCLWSNVPFVFVLTLHSLKKQGISLLFASSAFCQFLAVFNNVCMITHVYMCKRLELNCFAHSLIWVVYKYYWIWKHFIIQWMNEWILHEKMIFVPLSNLGVSYDCLAVYFLYYSITCNVLW